jgi:hypothetical protein
MPSESATALPPEVLALLPPEIISALPLLAAASLLLQIAGALAGYWVARKRGLKIGYWTILGFALGPFVLPLLPFAKKKRSEQRKG